MAADTTIKVEKPTRDKLAVIAAERGVSIGELVAELIEHTPSQADIDAQRVRTTAALREHFGFDPTPEERADLKARADAKMAAIELFEANRYAATRQISA